MLTPATLPLRIREHYNFYNLVIRSVQELIDKIIVATEDQRHDEWKYLDGEWTLVDEIPVVLLSFKYWKARNDGTPLIVCLSRYEHPTTGNKLVAGINLHYLNSAEQAELWQNLRYIMIESGEKRYNKAWLILPHIMSLAYRRYNEEQISEEEEIVTTIRIIEGLYSTLSKK